MKKKTYQQPEIKVVEIETSAILAGSNEQLGDGGNIFGAAREMYLDLDEDDYEDYED